jgi:hypothetical protein
VELLQRWQAWQTTACKPCVHTWDVDDVGLNGGAVEGGQVCSPLKDAAVGHNCCTLSVCQKPGGNLPQGCKQWNMWQREQLPDTVSD